MSLRWQIYGMPEALARLHSTPDETQRKLVLAMSRIVVEAVRRVKQKLSGPVLKNRTGHLRASVTGDVTATPQTVTGWFGVPAGPTAGYGWVHEFGWRGTQHVSAFQRRQTVVFGRPLAEPMVVQVGAFTRQVDFRERAYLRSTLAEMRGRIVEQLRGAVRESVQA